MTPCVCIASVFLFAAAATTGPSGVDSEDGMLVVVEATRIDAAQGNTPQYVESFSGQALADSGALDVMDAIDRNSAVFVRHVGGNNPALAQVSMRGYGENSAGRVLVKADGCTFNNFDMSGADFSLIPLSAIERVEILHGPQTVMHGGNASAGMINLVLRKPQSGRKSRVELHGGSWNTFGGSFGTEGGDDAEGVFYRANAAWDRSDGWRDSSGYDLYRLSGALRKEFENGSHLAFSSFYADSAYDLPGPLTYSEWKTDRRASDRDYRFYDYALHAGGVNFSGEMLIDDVRKLKFELGYSGRSDRFHASQTTLGYIQDSPFDGYAVSFTPQFSDTSRIAGFDNIFTLGGTLRRDERTGCNKYRFSGYTQVYREDQSRWTYGTFVRDEFFIEEALSLFAGSRIERMITESESVEHPSRNDNLSAFETGVNFRPDENVKLFTRFSRFYRAPFVDEVNYTSGGIVSPERGWNVDAGFESEFFKEFHAGAAVFVSETGNEIYYDPLLFDNVNFPGDVRREGVDFNVGWSRKNVGGIDLRYSFTDARIDGGAYDGGRMCAVPRHKAALNARVYLFDCFFIRGGCRHTGSQYTIGDFGNDLRMLKEYTVFSLGCRYEFSLRSSDKIAVSFDIDNLFDCDYCDYATYGANFYPASGRSCTARIEYRF